MRHPTPLCAAAARPPPRRRDRDAAARCRTKGRQRSARRAGGREGALLGTHRSVLRKTGRTRGKGGVQSMHIYLRRPFPPGVAPRLTSRKHSKATFPTEFKIQASTLISRNKILTLNSRSLFPHQNHVLLFKESKQNRKNDL